MREKLNRNSPTIITRPRKPDLEMDKLCGNCNQRYGSHYSGSDNELKCPELINGLLSPPIEPYTYFVERVMVPKVYLDDSLFEI